MLNPVLHIKEQQPAETAILNSALSLFLRLGESQVSVTRLVQTAAISRSVFYHYFRGKEDLYAGLLLSDEIGLGDILRRHLKTADLKNLMLETFEYKTRHIDKYHFLHRVERELLSKECQLERFVQWQRLRRNHFELFNECASRAKKGQSSNIQPEMDHYFGMVWALVEGYANLSDSDAYHELFQDKQGFKDALKLAVGALADINLN